MVFYIFVIAVVNLCLGFAVGVVLTRSRSDHDAESDLLDREFEAAAGASDENASHAPSDDADGNEASPVVPPNFSLEEKLVTI